MGGKYKAIKVEFVERFYSISKSSSTYKIRTLMSIS